MKEKPTLIESAVQYIRKNKVKTLVDLDAAKRKIAKKSNLPTFSNVKLLKAYHNLVKNKRLKSDKNLENLLRKRRIRSLSGIVVVSVLTKPYPCPGKCLYCPSQKGVPKSYLDGEPAVMRAILNKFDPYLQFKNRVRALKNTSHPTDKIELRIIGGTWSYYPKIYQTWFVKKCFEAANGRKATTLKELQEINERAKHRIVGISIETRPDFITEKEIKILRRLGVTRVEMGVQTIYDKILNKNLRGHSIAATIQATRLLKDAGFKICYQMMPNLPGSNLELDKKMFGELFSNSDFQPDFLKIYPTALLKEAPLYKLWREKKYRPYTYKGLLNLLKSIKKKIPYYCRIQRLIRDIPSPSVITGPTKVSNLRQIIAKEAKKEGWKCRCIRCREVKENYNPKEKLYLYRQDYNASEGKEIFLSYENKNREQLYSLLRLRIPSQVFEKKKHFIPVLQNAAIIRDIHTYGQLHPLSGRGPSSTFSPQHKGLGKKLIKEAEKIVYTEFSRSAIKEFGLTKIAVISGVGARNYYRKLGYRLKDNYIIKKT